VVPRAHWKGFLKLSLVSCPIALYPVIAANERVSFRQVNKQTGNRLRQQLVDSVTGEPVASSNKGRGYEIGENQFLLLGEDELETAEQEARRRPYAAAPPLAASQVTDPQQGDVETSARSFSDVSEKDSPRQEEELIAKRAKILSSVSMSAATHHPAPAPIPIENNRTIELDRFIARSQVDVHYLDTPYYIVPRDEVGQEAFAVIRDAMRRKDVVGMGRVVLARRERPIILEPMGDGIRGITLRYWHEIRDAADYFSDIPKLKLPDEMLRIAEHIVETKTSDFDPMFLEDRYRTVLIEKLKKKQAEVPTRVVVAKPSTENIINLMDILKRSLAAEQPARRAAATSRGTKTSKNSSSKRTHARGRKVS
jgi:non-homologous end joining protein Ku